MHQRCATDVNVCGTCSRSVCFCLLYFHSFLSYCREFLAELEDCIDDPVEVANKFVSKVVWSNVVLNLCSNIFHN